MTYFRLRRSASLLADAEGRRSGLGRETSDQAAAHFLTVSQVRVVICVPNVFSMSVMKTGPRGPGT